MEERFRIILSGLVDDDQASIIKMIFSFFVTLYINP